MLSIFTEFTINQLPLWAVLLVCAGVFLASLMDAIAGGGGIISVPTYLIAFSGLPTYYALGTNKLSAGIGTIFSTARFIKNGLVDWRLAGPGVAAALVGSMGGTWLQLRTPDIVLRYLLLAVLPVVATPRCCRWIRSISTSLETSTPSPQPIIPSPPSSTITLTVTATTTRVSPRSPGGASSTSTTAASATLSPASGWAMVR